MLDVLNHPQMLHSASVHMPIALAMLGIPLVFLSFVLPAEKKTFRQAALICYLLLVGSAFAAVKTGEDARDKVPPTIRSEAAKLLDNHAMMAEYVWMLGLAASVLLALSLVNTKTLRIPWVYRSMVGLALLLSLFTGGWIAFAAHYGGELVYTHGIGTKQLAAEFDLAPAEEGAAPTETPAAAEAEDDVIIPVRPIDMAEAATVSYVRDIVPIFEKHCIECHDDFQYDGDYDMTTVEAMKLQGAKEVEPGVVPGAPDESGVVLFIRGIYKPQMPKQADPLTEDELHLIRLWIAAGAIDDTDAPAPAPEPVGETPEPEPMPEESAPVEEPAPAEEAPEPVAPTDGAPETPAPVEAPAEEMKAAPAPAPAEEPAPAEAPAPVTAEEPAPAPEPAPEPTPEPEAAPAEPPAEETPPVVAPAPEAAPESPPVAEAPEAAEPPAPVDEGPVIEEQAAAPEPEPAPVPPANDAGAEPKAAEPVEAPAPAPSAHTPPAPAPAPRKPYRVNNPVRGPLA